MYQGLEALLKTITLKDKNNKDKNINHKLQQQHSVVVVKNILNPAHDHFQDQGERKSTEGAVPLASPAKQAEQHTDDVVVIQNRIEELFGCTVSKKNVEALMLLASKDHVDLEAMIQNTHTYHVQVKPCRNVFGAIHHAITNGGWNILDSTAGLYSHRKPVFATQEQVIRGIYNPPSVETIRAMYGLA